MSINKWYKTDDFTCLQCGLIYGTNAKNIYDECCKNLDWDQSNSKHFGRQKPLYAMSCDTNGNDVWFICYPNYDKNNLNNVVADKHVVNLIQDNGNKIIEIVENRIGMSHVANRITFVKTKDGYKFLGVYRIVKNGTTREYERVSKFYPY
ncbi:MAG: hypothetical protein IJY84_02690 [Clostridia bacterium]|nr:hypothetical protein [Clostridia bacterium]